MYSVSKTKMEKRTNELWEIGGRKKESKEKKNIRHVSYALELIVDNQLRNELDEAKHVNGLGKGRDDERVPSSVSPIN